MPYPQQVVLSLTKLLFRGNSFKDLEEGMPRFRAILCGKYFGNVACLNSIYEN